MKKILFCAFIALGAISCGNKNTCTIKGAIEAEDCLTEDARVVVTFLGEQTPDTLAIEKGKFKFTCDANPATLLQLAIIHLDKPNTKPDVISHFIPEAGKMEITVPADHEVVMEGSALNEALKEYNNKSQEHIDAYRGALRNGDEKAAETIFDEILSYNKEVYEANRTNFIGLQAFYFVSSEATLEEMEKYMEEAEPFIKEEERFINILEGLRKKAATAEGTIFVDFSGKTPEGKEIKLSDFVGKGDYVIVDFWASWCGPCRKEMPNIKDINSKFASKGLKVVSVAVWDGDNENSRKAIKELGMTWNHIFVGEDHSATDIYGINGIPHIIVFGPDGTILKRDLRGESLKEYISEIYSK